MSDARCCWNKASSLGSSRDGEAELPCELELTAIRHSKHFFCLRLSACVSKLPDSPSDQSDEIADCQATGILRHLNGCQAFHMRFSERRKKACDSSDLGALDAASLLHILPIKSSAGGIPEPAAHFQTNLISVHAARYCSANASFKCFLIFFFFLAA